MRVDLPRALPQLNHRLAQSPEPSTPIDGFVSSEPTEDLLFGDFTRKVKDARSKLQLSSAPTRAQDSWFASFPGGLARFKDSNQVEWHIPLKGVKCSRAPIATPTGQLIVGLEHQDYRSPGYRGIRLQAHDMKTGELLWKNEEAHGPAFCDDQGRLFARAADNQSLVRIDPVTGETLGEPTYLGLNGMVEKIEQISPDRLLVEARGTFVVDANSGEVIYKKSGGEYATQGDNLVTEAGRMHLELSNLDTGELIKKIELKPKNLTSQFSIISLQGRTPRGTNLVWANPISNAEPSALFGFDDDGNEVFRKSVAASDLFIDRTSNTYIVRVHSPAGFEGIDGDTGQAHWRWDHGTNSLPELFQTDDGGLYARFGDNSVRALRAGGLDPDATPSSITPKKGNDEIEIVHLEDAVVIDGIALPYND